MRVVVLGGGSSGEAFAASLRRRDEHAEITLVERELVGGECSYFACMPSKTLLRPTELVHAASLAPGVEGARLDPAGVFAWRDAVTGRGDDSSQADWLASIDVRLVRGDGRVARPGVVEAAGEELPYDRLVLATGSDPAIPPVEGLEGLDVWTNREATAASEVPASLLVLGGGPVGAELAQFFARIGSRVTVVDRSERLLSREDPAAGDRMGEVFADEGIDVILGAGVERVEAGFRATLDDGRTLEAERLLVATGRRARVEGLGLELVGVEADGRGIRVDERLRAAEHVWAIGDCTGIAMFTHVGKYQGHVAARDVAGEDVKADYRAIPRAIFTDPQVAAVGTTSGEGLVSASWDVERVSRSSTYERPKRHGFVKLVADPRRRVLVGAVAVGPESGEWLQQITLAIRAEVPIEVLRDTIQPYPTFSEGLFFAARDLPL